MVQSQAWYNSCGFGSGRLFLIVGETTMARARIVLSLVTLLAAAGLARAADIQDRPQVLDYAPSLPQGGWVVRFTGSAAFCLCIVSVIVDTAVCFDRGFIPWGIYEPLGIWGAMIGLPLGTLTVVFAALGYPRSWRGYLLCAVGCLCVVGALLAPSLAHG
jgi:hypothetical protein